MVEMIMRNKNFFDGFRINFILSRRIEPLAPVSKRILGVFSTSTKQEKPQSAINPFLKIVLS
jgi:hypothetical protein